jgi:putative FmdB family regulatory protein
MPIYEYRCADCGAHLEKMQKVSDAPLTVCESCGGKLEKQWSRTGFQFKGEGWYVTDYAGKGKSENGDAAKTETKADGAKTEKSSPAESTASSDGASKTTESSAKAPAKTD